MDSNRDVFSTPQLLKQSKSYIPKQAHLHPTVVIPAGNSRRELKWWGGQDKDTPGFCCPLFWDCPMQSQELDLILVVLSSSGYSRIAPGLLSPCSPCCSPVAEGIAGQGWLRGTVWEQPGSPALERSLQLPLRAKG